MTCRSTVVSLSGLVAACVLSVCVWCLVIVWLSNVSAYWSHVVAASVGSAELWGGGGDADSISSSRSVHEQSIHLQRHQRVLARGRWGNPSNCK